MEFLEYPSKMTLFFSEKLNVPDGFHFFSHNLTYFRPNTPGSFPNCFNPIGLSFPIPPFPFYKKYSWGFIRPMDADFRLL